MSQKFPVWKQWDGLTRTVVLFIGQTNGMQYNESLGLGEEVDHWIPVDDGRWVDVDPPLLSPEDQEKVMEIRMRWMRAGYYTEDVMNAYKEKGTLKSTVESIQEDRQNDYGDAKESFESIASYWSNYLARATKQHIELDATDVALMMVLFKVSRNSYKRKLDNVVDCASYADFALKFAKENENDLSF